MRWLFSFAMCICLTVAAAVAQAEESPGLYIIYDSSNSMWGELPDGTRKYEAARVAMEELAQQDFGDAEIALRMYGHRRKNDCSDSELVLSFSDQKSAHGRMIEAMTAVRPTGRTPIDLSLRQALGDFDARSGKIILISDGIESCDADPCALVRTWRDRNVRIDVHVVGLGLTGKEREAMECISDAAGTPYRDAFSASELVDGLTQTIAAPVPEATGTTKAGAAEPVPDSSEPEFALVVETADGGRQRGAGVLIGADGRELAVETFARYTPTPGEYLLRAGVSLVGGGIYQAAEVPVVIEESGKTIGRVVAPRPPSVSALFSMEGEALRSTVVRVYRDGGQIGSFKGDATAFVPEGALEFRSKLAGTSADTIVTEVFAAGDDKVIQFDSDIEVRLNVFFIADATGERLKGKPTTELWQDGAQVDKINSHSGGLVRPGFYRLVLDDGLNHFETELNVTSEPDQTPQIPVPSASLKVSYLDKYGSKEAAKRVFLRNLASGNRATRNSGDAITLLPGSYRIEGWPSANGYPDIEITVAAGETRELILEATN